MAKIYNVLRYVDDIKPNRFTDDTKVQWLNEVEGYIQTEVMMLALADVVQYDPEAHMHTDLLIKPPHDKLYALYLCAMIDFANGEYDKYANTMQLYNEFLEEYIGWYTLHFRPADGGCVREGYYLSAYALAVAVNGFEGTAEEWLESLKGEKGDPFEYEDFTPEQLERLRGPMGPAPEKGVDYWTPEDRAEMKTETEEMISSARTEALAVIASAESDSSNRLSAAAESLTESVKQEVEAAGNEKIGEITHAGESKLSGITEAGTAQVQQIEAAGEEEVQKVRGEGETQVGVIRGAVEEIVERVETAAGMAETARAEAQSAADEAGSSAENAKSSASSASSSSMTAMSYSDQASRHSSTASLYATRASTSESNAAKSATNAAESATDATASKDAAETAAKRAEEALGLYPTITLTPLTVQPGMPNVLAITVKNADGTVQSKTIENGVNGITPHIGNNGNWWIGSVDTGVLARGVSSEIKVTRNEAQKYVMISASDADGATIAFVYDGKDYVLTDEDKREIADMVNAFVGGLPEHTDADENKFLRVIGGKAAWMDDTKQERFLGADKAGARLVVGDNGYITTEFPIIEVTETAAVVSATPVSGSEIKVVSHVEQGVWGAGHTLVLRHVSGKNVMNIAEYLRKDFGGNTVTRDGLTAVINDDDTVTVTGTAATTSSGYARIANGIRLWRNGGELMFPAGTYTLPTDGGMRFVLEVYDDSGAWLMNAAGTFTIDKQFYVAGITIGWPSDTVVNATVPLAMVMGNKLPSTGLKYTGAEYRVEFSSTNMTSGTYNWQTGELVTETGETVWKMSDMGPFPALDGENVLFTGAGTVEVTYSAIGSSGATAVIGGGEKFDPEAWGLPVLYLTGDTTAMTKDNAVELLYTYGSQSGTCTMKWQGSSSVAYLKKNYTIKFDNAFEAAEGWGDQTKYCLKANYIDHSHARNIVNARLWGQIVASRKTVPDVFKNLPNYGAVDGFPILIVLNNTFHGLYTFNIPKDGWMMGMGSGANECILCAGNACPANGFKEEANLVDDLEIEYISDENNTAWAVTSVNRLINACINSDGTDIDTTIAQYLDWDSAIDYYIFAVLIEGWDIMLKNYILTTFNGVKWYFSAYDLDATHGLYWDGSKFLPANYDPSFGSYANQHRAMELVRLYKKDALKARYAELRESVLSESNVATMFGNFCGQIPSAVYAQEAKTWSMIPNTSVNNVSQIRDYYRMRLAYADKWIENM